MNEKLFAPGARVAFLGDSITHAGRAVAYIQKYYLEHFPERKVKLYNCGIGGDTAAGCIGRLDYSLDMCRPTEAVVMFGVNDLHAGYYRPDATPEQRAQNLAIRRRHTENMKKLVRGLSERGLPVTFCSGVGRDGFTPGEIGETESAAGMSEALALAYDENRQAITGAKNTVDYRTPFQALQKACAERGLPSLFQPDRTHPNNIGQEIMARIFLAGQGLPVLLPTAEDFAEGYCEAALSPELTETLRRGSGLADIAFIYPHQANRCPGLDLAGRIAYWQAEAEKLTEDTPGNRYMRSMIRHYAEHAPCEEKLREEYRAAVDALYAKNR